jgi:hypothetical protein
MGGLHESNESSKDADDERKSLLASQPLPAAAKMARFLKAVGVAVSWMSVRATSRHHSFIFLN